MDSWRICIFHAFTYKKNCLWNLVFFFLQRDKEIHETLHQGFELCREGKFNRRDFYYSQILVCIFHIFVASSDVVFFFSLTQILISSNWKIACLINHNMKQWRNYIDTYFPWIGSLFFHLTMMTSFEE